MDNYEKYIGKVFDNRYHIDSLVGVGGMAVVYKAIDRLMQRVVAVKILRDDISTDEESVRRFINESKAVAMLSHPNIVSIYDVSVRDDVKYIVMEYIDGITLKNYMTRRQSLSFREILGYTMQVLRALDHAHKKGIVHRDIKPQNIMLLKNGIIKVMDFGIAKLPNAENVKMSDKAIGTVYYISPEQASGNAIDARSDIYSLGAMLYEMSTGTIPFDDDSPVNVALMQVNNIPDAPRKRKADIPIGLEQIILKAMEKKPSDRYQSAELMASDLEKLRANPNIVFKPKFSEKLRKFVNKRSTGKVSRSMFPIILGVFTSFFTIFCICALVVYGKVFSSKDALASKPTTIEVENYVGMTYTEELKRYFDSSKKYNLVSVEYEYSTEVPENKIISQSPSAGEKKKITEGKQYCEISLTISSGEKTFGLEDYTSGDYRLVLSTLRSRGVICTVVKEHNEIFEKGTVIKTEPAAGSEIAAGDTLTIYVSIGAEVKSVEVPDFVGKTEADTLLGVFALKLRVGNVKYEKSDKKAGTVISQSEEKGSVVEENSYIDFVVSSGDGKSEAGKDKDKDNKPKETESSTSETVEDPVSTETVTLVTEEPTESETDDPAVISETETTDPIETDVDTDESSSAEEDTEPESADTETVEPESENNG